MFNMLSFVIVCDPKQSCMIIYFRFSSGTETLNASSNTGTHFSFIPVVAALISDIKDESVQGWRALQQQM